MATDNIQLHLPEDTKQAAIQQAAAARTTPAPAKALLQRIGNSDNMREDDRLDAPDFA